MWLDTSGFGCADEEFTAVASLAVALTMDATTIDTKAELGVTVTHFHDEHSTGADAGIGNNVIRARIM